MGLGGGSATWADRELRWPPRRHYGVVACEQWREAISALADGEDPGIDERLVAAHLARCSECREFQALVEQGRTPLRIASARPMPDLSGRIVKLNALLDRSGRWRVVRGLLAVVALEILVLSVPALIWGQEAATSQHAARHLGAFTAAYAAALLVVAIRPARARTVLPVAATLAAALVITAAVDVVEGRVPLWGEALHVPEVLSVVLVWLLALPSGRLAHPPSADDPALPVLRLLRRPAPGPTDAPDATGEASGGDRPRMRYSGRSLR